MKRGFFCFSLAFVMFFPGCGSTAPVVTTYRNPGVAVDDHAVLYVYENIIHVGVDIPPPDSNPYRADPQIILLPSGEHRISGKYSEPRAGRYYSLAGLKSTGPAVRQGFSVKIGHFSDDTSSRLFNYSDPVTIVHKFEPGHYYYLEADNEKYEFVLVDETDPSSAWEDWKVKKAEERIVASKDAIRSLR